MEDDQAWIHYEFYGRDVVCKGKWVNLCKYWFVIHIMKQYVSCIYTNLKVFKGLKKKKKKIKYFIYLFILVYSKTIRTITKIH